MDFDDNCEIGNGLVLDELVPRESLRRFGVNGALVFVDPEDSSRELMDLGYHLSPSTSGYRGHFAETEPSPEDYLLRKESEGEF